MKRKCVTYLHKCEYDKIINNHICPDPVSTITNKSDLYFMLVLLLV